MVVSPAGLENKNDCTRDGHQQISRRRRCRLVPINLQQFHNSFSKGAPGGQPPLVPVQVWAAAALVLFVLNDMLSALF
jgi:hypothetical protein